ncbi:MAG: hypothetical protein M1412_01740 [Deltaproteobacteria bacterium]|nr:hypothetical protein [Deltaproteobacteria bacterium]MCL5891877.1 hypothetical protein [Deltaproteobacteria bacterium]
MKTEQKEVKHTDVKGFIKDQNNFLKITNLFTLLLLGLSFILAFKAYIKPPVVIRENAEGQIQVIKNLLYNDKVTPLEINTFSKLFLRRYLAYSSYGITNQLDRALRMMTGSFEKSNIADIEKDNTVQGIEREQIHSQLKIKKLKTTKVEGEYIYLKIYGNIIRKYYGSKKEKIETFKGDLVLKKVKRTAERPYGLAAANYSQIILNKLTEGK